MKSSNQGLKTSVESQKLRGLVNDIQDTIDLQSQMINDKFGKKSRNHKKGKSIHNAGLEFKFHD